MANEKIHLSGDYVYEEAVANAAITPGSIIELMSTGKVKDHATEGGYAQRMVAIEDANQGAIKTTDYASAALVSYHIAIPGSRYQVFIKAGENIVIGDELISDGAGSLIKNGSEASGTTVKQIIAYAEAAVDLSASGAVATLLAIRFV